LNRGSENSSGRLALIYFANGTGGTAYERQLLRCLQQSFLVEEHAVESPIDWPRWIRTPAALLDLYRSVRQTSSGHALVIDTLDAALLRRGRATRNWVIVHHLDFSANRHARIYQPLGPYILRCLRSAEKVVAVSTFWKRYLEGRGIASVELIYNPFSVEEFVFSDDHVEAFKRRLGLVGKPILYLGNRAEGKGVEQAYRALRGIDAHFVATGKDARPLDHLRTEYLQAREYRLLLKASTGAVTMSTFDEGWCRTAHEAMLCGTPVVGSGRGGMGELLRGGDQVVCETFDELAPQVSSLLADPHRRHEIGQRGFAFARQFTVERFSSAWRRLIQQSMRQPSRSTA
jgi:glycosyltransferase involved in cell wall biosynthesis